MHQFGLGKNSSMIQCLGLYRAVNHVKIPLSTPVYPVPDPKNLFLGVHLTSTFCVKAKKGPTASPRLNSEQSKFHEGWHWKDVKENASGLLSMLRSDFHDFPKLAKGELHKTLLKRLIQDAAILVLDVADIIERERLDP